MSIIIEARKEALSYYIGTPIEDIEDVNFENLFYDRTHRFTNERPLGFYLVLHRSERDYIRAVGAINAIGSEDGFLFFLTDRKGKIDRGSTKMVKQIAKEDAERFKTFVVTFWNETEHWARQSLTVKGEHEQDADTAARRWADKNKVEIDIISIEKVGE